MDKQEINNLYQKYLNGSLTEAERRTFDALIIKAKEEDMLSSLIDQDWEQFDQKTIIKVPEFVADRVFLNVVAQQRKGTLKPLWPRIAVAATVAAIIFGASFFYFSSQNVKTVQTTTVVNDVSPGRQGATLILADGQKILINEATAGNIANQSGVKISKTADGQIIYEVTDNKSASLAYNTLSTSRGEQTQVRLPDGSVVFLNAASSLKYPASFAKLETRHVSLTGEGYFEIAKDKAHPFIVATDKQEVRVLGTHFNINTYEDEAIVKTTLVEGSVRISLLGEAKAEAILKPGQQARLTGSKIGVFNVNAEEAVAWKKGDFVFDHEDFESIIRKVEKWYDVKFIYQKGKYNKLTLSGSVSRANPLSVVLGSLQEAGKLKFKIEGRRVTIM